MVAQYYIYFYDYTQAEAHLRSILDDELAFYGYLKEQQKDDQIEEKDDKKVDDKKGVDLERIDFDEAFKKDSFDLRDELFYSNSAHPLTKILYTLTLMAECLSSKQKHKEAR